MMSLWDALRMNMMISYQELVRTFLSVKDETSHKELGLVADGGFVYLNGIQDDNKLALRWGDKSCFIQPPNSSNLTTGTAILPCISQN